MFNIDEIQIDEDASKQLRIDQLSKEIAMLRAQLNVPESIRNTIGGAAIGAGAGMRSGVAQALHHTSSRSAFGKRLIEQPLMRNVLADLSIESEAATASVMRLARSYDE